MGLAKRRMEEEEYYKNLATKALVELGFIKPCEIHEEIILYKGHEAEPAVYARATDWLKRNYPDYNDFKLFSEKVKDAMEQTCESCPRCDKWERE